MLFPNKIINYEESVLGKIVPVLTELKNHDITIFDLYIKIKEDFMDIFEFINVLDCLFALRKIDYLKEEGVLHYVI